MNILEQIILEKKIEESKRKKNDFEVFMDSELFSRKTNRLSVKMQQNTKPTIIAEFKRKSPSNPNINVEAVLDTQLRIYENSGASALSVLTDNKYFGGDINDIKKAREISSQPILRKDFIVSEYQIYEAKASGADIILLIAAALDISDIAKLARLTKKLDMDILLEIHNEKELCYLDIQPNLVGINSRNLKTFQVNMDLSIQLAKRLPQHIPAIAESGIHTPEELAFLYKNGFHGFLIGETFMKNDNTESFIKNFIAKSEELCS